MTITSGPFRARYVVIPLVVWVILLLVNPYLCAIVTALAGVAATGLIFVACLGLGPALGVISLIVLVAILGGNHF